MSLWRQLSRGLHVLARRTAADRDVDDELRHYLAEAADSYGESGLPPAEARRAARLDVGSTIAVREQVRDHGWERAIGTVARDARLAGRMLRKSPVFTVVVVFVIAVGSGAVTTIFSGMNALVLRPVPGIVDSARLVNLRPARRDGTVAQQASYPSYAFLRDRSQTFDGIAAWGRVSLAITAGGQGTAILGNMVSSNYFDVLGIRPAAGRFFAPDEHRTPGSHPVIVVSHAFWTSVMNADPAAIGRTIAVNGMPFVVVGVAPESFRGVFTGLRIDAWVPLMMQPALRPRSNLTGASWLWLFGRLREGSDVDAAQQELSALAVARARDEGQAAAGGAAPAVQLLPFTGLPNGERGQLLGFMALLLGAASLVLLIAGVNVAAMLSARYAARGRELAVRAALGAGRTRLLRQLLTEILALFLLGALGGFVVAVLATAALEQLPLPTNVSLSLELSPDWRVLAFALSVSLVTGLIFGLAPARQATRRDVTSCLRDGSAGADARRTLMGRTLIVVQLALSLVLLVAAGLFMRALNQGHRIEPGFEREGVTTASLEPESWGYPESRAREFYRRLRDRVEALPGAAAVSYTGRVPLMNGSSPDRISAGAGAEVAIHYASVDVDYFTVLRLPVLQGRAFREADDGRSPRVAVVNETLARKLWPEGNAIGRAFRFRDVPTTVVGVARDAKYATLDESTPAFAYFPIAQVWQPTQTLLVRATGNAEPLARGIQDAMRSIDPLLPPPRTSSLQQMTSIVLLPQRAAAIVTGALGGVGLLLASVGLYGILAFSANRRTREIGIRVALGATRSSVVGLIVREGLRLTAAGIALGLVLAAAATRLISSWLLGVSPLDRAAFSGMSLIFLAVAIAASYVPARRAAASDPLRALRVD